MHFFTIGHTQIRIVGKRWTGVLLVEGDTITLSFAAGSAFVSTRTTSPRALDFCARELSAMCPDGYAWEVVQTSRVEVYS